MKDSIYVGYNQVTDGREVVFTFHAKHPKLKKLLADLEKVAKKYRPAEEQGFASAAELNLSKWENDPSFLLAPLTTGISARTEPD